MASPGRASDVTLLTASDWMPAFHSREEDDSYGFSVALDESTKARYQEARDFLRPLNSILQSRQSSMFLSPVLTQADGYCFFYVAAAMANLGTSKKVAQRLFACALEASSKRYLLTHTEYPFGETEAVRVQRIKELLRQDETAQDLDRRTSFEIAIMDKYEGLLLGQRVLPDRRYGDVWELLALLEATQASAIKLDISNNLEHVLLPSRTPLASLNEVADLLLAGEVDTLLLHWNEHRVYEHYCTVSCGSTPTPWVARDSVQTAMRELLGQSCLVRSLDCPLPEARVACASLLTALNFRSILPEVGYATPECWAAFRSCVEQPKRLRLPRCDYAHCDQACGAASSPSCVRKTLQELFPARPQQEVDALMRSLQWYFGADSVWFAALVQGRKGRFRNLCANGMYPKQTCSSVSLTREDMSQIQLAWNAFRAIPYRMVKEVYDCLPLLAAAPVVYRGLSFGCLNHVDEYVVTILKDGFTRLESFSTDVCIARTFASGPKSAPVLELQKLGYEAYAPTVRNVLLVCVGYRPMASGQLNCSSVSESEVWLRDESAFLFQRFSSPERAAPALSFLRVPATHQEVLLEELKGGLCEVLCFTKTDQTFAYERHQAFSVLPLRWRQLQEDLPSVPATAWQQVMALYEQCGDDAGVFAAVQGQLRFVNTWRIEDSSSPLFQDFCASVLQDWKARVRCFEESRSDSLLKSLGDSARSSSAQPAKSADAAPWENFFEDFQEERFPHEDVSALGTSDGLSQAWDALLEEASPNDVMKNNSSQVEAKCSSEVSCPSVIKEHRFQTLEEVVAAMPVKPKHREKKDLVRLRTATAALMMPPSRERKQCLRDACLLFEIPVKEKGSSKHLGNDAIAAILKTKVLEKAGAVLQASSSSVLDSGPSDMRIHTIDDVRRALHAVSPTCKVSWALRLKSAVTVLLTKGSRKKQDLLRRIAHGWGIKTKVLDAHRTDKEVEADLELAVLKEAKRHRWDLLGRENTFHKRLCECAEPGCSCENMCTNTVQRDAQALLCASCLSYASGQRYSRAKLCRCCVAGSPCPSCNLHAGQCCRKRLEGERFVKCGPCVLEEIITWCERSSLEYRFLRPKFDAVLEQISPFVSFKFTPGFTGGETAALVALKETQIRSVAKAIREHICSALAEMPDNNQSTDAFEYLPTYVLLRRPDGQDWEAHKMQQFFISDHRSGGLKLRSHLSLEGAPPDSAVELQAFGAVLRMQYAGPFLNCTGAASSFQSSPQSVPYHPSHLPVRRRPTYWRYVSLQNHVDMIVASKEQLFLALLDMSLEVGDVRQDVVAEPLLLPELRSLKTIARCQQRWFNTPLSDFHRFLENPCLLLSPNVEALSDEYGMLSRTYFSCKDWKMWQKRPEQAARPVLLHDYESLGMTAGMKYVGRIEDDGTVHDKEIPRAIFHSQAFFEAVASGEPRQLQTSYYNLHMQVMRAQPTLGKLQKAVRMCQRDGAEVPSMQEVFKLFPATSHGFFKEVWSDVVEQLSTTQWALARMRSLPPILLPADVRQIPTARSASGKVPETMTDKSQTLAAENLQMGLHDLMSLNPRLIRENRRPRDPLRTQRLAPNSLEGLCIAGRRGLTVLVHDYLNVLMKHFRYNKRPETTVAGSAPHLASHAGSGAMENTDLEQRHESLPLSSVLLHELDQHGCKSVTVAASRGLWRELQRLRAYVAPYLEGSSGEQETTLTQHQETLGVVTWLVEQEADVFSKWAVNTAASIILGNKSEDPQARGVKFKVLSIFATTAWLEMTERWFRMPPASAQWTSMVCNHNTMEIRAFGRLVYDEHELSKKPLVDHLCCMCGQLLNSKTRNAQNPKEIGVPGAPCQERRKLCSWAAMPLFLLLWSKKRIADAIPSVFEWDQTARTLKLRHGWASAPWLHFKHAGRNEKDDLPRRPGEVLDESKPWWFCRTCFYYWSPSAGPDNKRTQLERVPMRNKLEGIYTRWHVDLAYVHLYPFLKQAYPEHHSLPVPDAALQWHRKYADFVGLIKKEDPQGSKHHRKHVLAIESAREELHSMEKAWFPPPHACPWGTPVPLKYFQDAAGVTKVWTLQENSKADLVPREQPDLMQDVPAVPDLSLITSGDARACISICRPHGCFSEHRKIGRGPFVSTMPHQSGELVLRPLTQRQDKARGMLSSLVCSPAFEKDKLRLKDNEVDMLRNSLPWLRQNNPWFHGYASALSSATECHEFCRTLASEGRLLGTMSDDTETVDNRRIRDCLGEEAVGAFVPLDDLKAPQGTYRHMRAAAEAVYCSELRSSLPKAWRDTHMSDLLDQHGKPIQQVPAPFREFGSFTDISVRDPHLDAKVWVQQHKWGTGSYRSTLDCVTSRNTFRRARFWSLDGEFLDDKDPQWMFFQRESEYKWRLLSDFHGKKSQGADSSPAQPHEISSQLLSALTPGPTASQKSVARKTPGQDVQLSKREDYSFRNYSRRVGHLIPESNQALTKTRKDWLEIARPGNMGSPSAMTTVVANIRTSTIVAHVVNGPLSLPDPEHTVAYLTGGLPANVKQAYNVTRHAAIQTADYLRRRREFESRSYRRGHDALRGRMRLIMRRRESQKRGWNHDHYNEFPERCGKKKVRKHNLKGCHVVSRWCLRSGVHCRLPSSCSNNERHMQTHTGSVTAELLRPYPLGSITLGPESPPDLAGASLEDTISQLEEKFWNDSRMQGQAGDVPEVLCEGSLLERARTLASSLHAAQTVSLDLPMTLQDLYAAYYVRRLQTEVVPHVCKLGYCRQSWSDKCKYCLPCPVVVERPYHDENTNRWVPVRRNLPDDAYNKTTSLQVLADTLMNVQINEHSPEATSNSLSYSIKYETKPEPAVKVKAQGDTDDSVLNFLQLQMVSLSSASAFVLGDPVTECSNGEMPLILPSWNPLDEDVPSQGLWRRFVQRVPFVNMEAVRDGYTRQVLPNELLASLLFCTASKMVRYFGKDSDETEAKGEEDEQEDDMKRSKLKAAPRVHAERLNRWVWDDVPDEPDHTLHDTVLTELLPGERLLIGDGSIANNIWRRLRNGSMKFGRYETFDLSLEPDRDGIPARSLHFEQRLFQHLAWTCVKKPRSPEYCMLKDHVLVTFLPACVDVSRRPLASWMCAASTGVFLETNPWMKALEGEGLQVAWIKNTYLSKEAKLHGEPDNDCAAGDCFSFEAVCIFLEKALQVSSSCCLCCKKEAVQKCFLCAKASGWHRCLCRPANDDNALAHYNFMWKPGDLYNMQGHDVDVCVLHMLDQAVYPGRIIRMLDDLKEQDLLSAAKFEELVLFVRARSGADQDIAGKEGAHGRLHGVKKLSSAECAHQLREVEARLQSYWDDEAGCYKAWKEFSPVRSPPSQHLAFLELKARDLANQAICVALVAPAGFGKSDLLKAWNLHLCSQEHHWPILGPTGISASNCGGNTIHSYLYLSSDGVCKLLMSPARKAELSLVRGQADCYN